MVHALKTWPEPFRAVQAGIKRHEVRVADRDFKVGDYILLEEYEPIERRHTGRHLMTRITYITEGGQHDLPDNLCVLSIEVFE